MNHASNYYIYAEMSSSKFIFIPGPQNVHEKLTLVVEMCCVELIWPLLEPIITAVNHLCIQATFKEITIRTGFNLHMHLTFKLCRDDHIHARFHTQVT